MLGLSLYRQCARIIACVLLLSALAGLRHGGRDDFACAPTGSAAASDILAGGATDAGEHCLVCHWTRSLRSPFASAPQFDSVLLAAAPVDSPNAIATRAPALDRLPARAPPVAL